MMRYWLKVYRNGFVYTPHVFTQPGPEADPSLESIPSIPKTILNTLTQTLSKQNIADESTLHIVCPTQKRPLPLLLACFWCLVFVPAIVKHLSNLTKNYSYVWLALTLLFGAFFAILVYRSFIFHDELCIFRGSSAPKGYKFLLAAETIRAVRILPVVEPWSSEGKLEMLALSQGRIEIETTTQSFRFGSGLHAYVVEETLEKIVHFCRLK